MVSAQIEARGIKSENVLMALREVPRHLFISGGNAKDAYEDHPVSIGDGQTISQPYIVAEMVEQLSVEPGDNILEVGCGSGYQAAILSYMGAKVTSVERIKELADSSSSLLSKMGYSVEVVVGDGSLGYLSNAPYNGIIVGAAAPAVPGPLLEQLADNGKLVIPVGTRFLQELKVFHKQDNGLVQYDRGGCVFVPLIGEYGWDG
jgi:protein-L-isoaspartate(D-aspartate) O-methyltransferase